MSSTSSWTCFFHSREKNIPAWKHICARCLTSMMISQTHVVTGWRIILRYKRCCVLYLLAISSLLMSINFLFNDFLVEINDVEVKFIEGEIDDTQGIFDIQVIIVISCTWLYYKYLMLMSCLLKQHQSIRGSKRSTSRCCRRIARRSTDGQDVFRS